MYLTYDGWCTLCCRRQTSKGATAATAQSKQKPVLVQPYDMLVALNEKLFTDTELTANNGVSIPAHNIILRQVLEKEEAESLNGLDEEELRVILHFVYARSLPPGIKIEPLERCLLAVKEFKGFDHFREIVRDYKLKSVLRESKTFP